MHIYRSVMLWCFILSLDIGREIFCRPSSKITDATEQSKDINVDMLKYKLPEVWWSHALDDKQLTTKRSWYVSTFCSDLFGSNIFENSLKSFWMSITFQDARFRYWIEGRGLMRWGCMSTVVDYDECHTGFRKSHIKSQTDCSVSPARRQQKPRVKH